MSWKTVSLADLLFRAPYVAFLAALQCALFAGAGAAQQVPASASVVVPVSADTGTALTPDMRALDAYLHASTRMPLERWGHTFYALAAVVADTASASEPSVSEIGMIFGAPEPRTPVRIADNLRSALFTTYAREARTVGIVTDSIAGSFEEATDGIEGPPFPRRSIAELEDRSGRCRRVERAYRFVAETGSGRGFGRVVYDGPHVTRCERRGYWSSGDTTQVQESLPLTPPRVRPIRRPLSISSLDHNYFSTVGRFTGTMTVFDDSIVVELDTAFVTRLDRGKPDRMRLDSVTVGVGIGSADSWSTTDHSNALRLSQPWPVRGKVERHRVRLVLPHVRQSADAERWLVVTMHHTTRSSERGGYTGPSTSYAHSRRGVLAPEQ